MLNTWIIITGHPVAYVEEQLEAGKDVILEIEIQGALKVKEASPETLLLFVTPPTAEELRSSVLQAGEQSPRKSSRAV